MLHDEGESKGDDWNLDKERANNICYTEITFLKIIYSEDCVTEEINVLHFKMKAWKYEELGSAQ